MSNKSKFSKLLSLFLALVLVFSYCSATTFAAESTTETPSVVITANNELSFSSLERIKLGEHVEFNLFDAEGNPATVGIERVNLPSDAVTPRGTSNSWQVYYNGVTINASFYMTVTNNKVTSVYDYNILIIGGTYDNESLTKTTTYGKLSFKVTAYPGVMAASCWLKGTVTGSGNNINVTWQM